MDIGKLTIIGGGNLGSAIAEGLVKSGKLSTDSISITRRNTGKLDHLASLGVNVTNDNEVAASDAKIILICVKPWQIEAVLNEIVDHISPETIVASCVSGVSLQDLKGMTTKKLHLFRVMPNTAIAVMQSMTCISTIDGKNDDLKVVQQIFDQLGKTLVISEELMDAATVLAACGIAYCLRFIRAASQGGIEIGFSADAAQKIAAQTAKGAATLLLQHGSHPEGEIDKVTTPKGCTIAGLNEMEHRGFSSALIKGIKTSFEKI